MVDDLSTKRGFGDAADRRAFISDLHALHPRPCCRTVIYATRDPADALEVADRIAVLRRGRIVQCGTPAEIRRAPAGNFVARLFQWASRIGRMLDSVGGRRRCRQDGAFERFEALIDLAERDLDGAQAIVHTMPPDPSLPRVHGGGLRTVLAAVTFGGRSRRSGASSWRDRSRP